MIQFKERRCRECGEGTVRLVAQQGRKAVYKLLALDVPPTLVIPTCDHCGAEWHNDDTAAAFSEAMDDASVRQADVERAIGLSPGYLSKIKRGEHTPEPALVTQLALARTC